MVGWNFITIANREHIEGEQKHKVFQRLHIIAAKTEPPEWSSGYAATVIRRTYLVWFSVVFWGGAIISFCAGVGKMERQTGAANTTRIGRKSSCHHDNGRSPPPPMLS